MRDNFVSADIKRPHNDLIGKDFFSDRFVFAVLLFLGRKSISAHQQSFGAVESDTVRTLCLGKTDFFRELNVRQQLNVFPVLRLGR